MTCIAGRVSGSSVTLAADAFAGNTGVGSPHGHHKLFARDGLLIGCSSSFRMIDLLRYELTIPPMISDLDEWARRHFSSALRETFGGGGFRKKDNEVETGGTFVFAAGGRLFQVESDFAVLPVFDYTAVGSGSYVALGALHAGAGALDAVRAAVCHTPTCCDPVSFLTQTTPER